MRMKKAESMPPAGGRSSFNHLILLPDGLQQIVPAGPCLCAKNRGHHAVVNITIVSFSRHVNLSIKSRD
jgi:hypothetical protein